MDKPKFNWLGLATNFLTAAVIVSVIGGFILKGHVKYALIITLAGILGHLIMQFLVYVNNRAEHDKHVVNLIASQAAQERDFYFNRIVYLQDRLNGVTAEVAHVINNTPAVISEPEPRTGFMDFATIDGVRVEKSYE